MKLTALPVDHAAPDSVALLVEADGKKVLYSGDLRFHGRKQPHWQRLIHDLRGTLDVLILEGTTIGRPGATSLSERALEPRLTRILQGQQSLALVFCSAQNLDRIITIHNVVKKLNKRMVVDLYGAYALHVMRDMVPELPQWDWPEMRVVQWRYQQELLRRAGKEDFIEKTAKHRIGWQGLQAHASEYPSSGVFSYALFYEDRSECPTACGGDE